MDSKMTRRRVLGLAAGAAAATLSEPAWIFAVNQEGQIVKAAVAAGVGFVPRLLSAEQAETLGLLVDTLIPRTTTPGAKDARVHEYIDLALSLDPEAERDAFLAGLEWLESRCQTLLAKPLVQTTPDERHQLLAALSDEHDTHAPELVPGAVFFADLKRRTIFGYYTSKEGRVEELGLPETVTMETYRGCQHQRQGHHA